MYARLAGTVVIRQLIQGACMRRAEAGWAASSAALAVAGVCVMHFCHMMIVPSLPRPCYLEPTVRFQQSVSSPRVRLVVFM